MACPTLRFFSADAVRKALPMAEAVQVMKSAFAQLSSGQAILPPRTHLGVEDRHGNALIMPAYLSDPGAIGVKIITLFDGNPQRNLPRIQALVCLLDGTTGTPLAVMNGTALTAIRTGATSGVATDFLALPGASTVALLGAGVQARTQLEAICTVRSIRKAWVFDTSDEKADAFAREMGRAMALEIASVRSAAEAVRGAEIICTATTSKTPVFCDGDLQAGTHINAVGSYQPEVQEIPAQTVLRADLVVDHRDSALAETGDLIIPMAANLFKADHIRAELGEIVRGERPGRSSPEAVTLFKSVGIAVQDLAAALRVLTLGTSLGLGTEVDC